MHDYVLSAHDAMAQKYVKNGKTGEAQGVNSLHHEPSLSDFYGWVTKRAHSYCGQLNINMNKFDLIVGKSWLSYVDKNTGSVPSHSHADHHLSFIYYLRTPEDCDLLCFGDPNSKSINEPFYNAFSDAFNNIDSYNRYNSTLWRFEVSAGQLWIFPSKLLHWTERVKPDFQGTRQCIAGDFLLIYNNVNNKTPFGLYHESHWRKF